MNRRVMPIVIAVVLAILAGLVVFLFARSAGDRTAASEQPVNVLVTAQQVPIGTTMQAAMDAGSLKQTQVPLRLRPAGAVEAVTPANANLVAVTDLPVNQMVLDGTFAAAVPQSGPIQVPEGLVAISVPLADPNKVGTFLRPGSEIGVFDTVAIPPQGDAAGAPVTTTRLLVDRAMVLAIGPTTEAQEATAAPEAWSASLVTVAVTQVQAEKLIQAFQSGTPYMALLGENTSLKQSAGVGDADLFN